MFAAIILTVIYYRFCKMEQDAWYDDIDEDDGDDRDAFKKQKLKQPHKMKIDITYHEVLQIDADISKQSAQSICFGLFMRDKIVSFYNHNRTVVDMAKKKVTALIQEHVELDEQGECKFINKIGGGIEYIWKTPSSKKAYDAACTEFLSRTTTIVI